MSGGHTAPRSRHLNRIGWLAAALLLACPLSSLHVQGVALSLKAGIAGLAALTAMRPADGLLVYAGLGPLATILFLLSGSGAPLRMLEAMTLAVLLGWTARLSLRPRPLEVTSGVRWSVALLLSAAFASTAVSVAVTLAENPATPVLTQLGSTIRGYLVHASPFMYAVQFAAGLALVACVADTTRARADQRDRILWMAIAGATAAAFFNVLRIVFLAVAREDTPRALATYLATVRVNVHFSDWNAAGSYFALMAIAATGFMAHRWFSAPCVAMLALGVWLSGSRTAILAAVLGIAGSTLLAAWPRRPGRRLALVAVAVAALILLSGTLMWKLYPAGRNEALPAAWSYRVLTMKAGLDLAASAPVFGVGLGRFAPLAAPRVGMPENAHNNFIQIVAELGIPGLLLFLWMIAEALHSGMRSTTAAARGLVAGLVAFLLTCLAGHPLLVAGAAFPFWLCLGLAAGGGSGDRGLPAVVRWTCAAFLACLIVILPFRIAAAPGAANREHAAIGFSQWQRDADGFRYRWAGARSTFFVPSDARAARIPLRYESGGPGAIDVRILLDGREANRVRLDESIGWTSVRLLLGSTRPGAYTRVDLEVFAAGSNEPVDVPPTHAAGAVRVGRVVIEP